MAIMQAGFDDTCDFSENEVQEAFNWLSGNPGSILVFQPGTYLIRQQLYVPPLQNCQIDAEPAVFHGDMPADQSLMVFDSAMNCSIDLGTLVYGGNDKALHLHPANGVPIDHIPAWTETRLWVQTIARPAAFTPRPNGAVGISLDGRLASMVANEVRIHSILNYGVQVAFYGTHRLNHYDFWHLHANWTGALVLSNFGDVAKNWISLGWGTDLGATMYPPAALPGAIATVFQR